MNKNIKGLKERIIGNLNELEKEIVRNLKRIDKWILGYLNDSMFLSYTNIKYNDVKSYINHYNNEFNLVSNLGNRINGIKKYIRNVDNKYLFHDNMIKNFVVDCITDFECVENFYGYKQTNEIKKEFDEKLKENFYNNKIKTLSKDKSHEIKLDIMELDVCFDAHNEILDRVFNGYHKLINNNFNIDIHEWKNSLKEHPFKNVETNAYFFVSEKWNQINKKELNGNKNNESENLKEFKFASVINDLIK